MPDKYNITIKNGRTRGMASTNYIVDDLTAPGFPPHGTPDLVDMMADVQREWRRDNGVWCLEKLREILDLYPWSKEAADMFGLVSSKLHHIFSPVATYRLHEWIAQHQAVANVPYTVDDGLHRFKVMKDVLTQWLAEKNVERGEGWAMIADIGAQQGEMGINWIGIPGAKEGYMFEVALTNNYCGRMYYHDDRLHFVCSMADHVPAPDESFDVVFLSGILEHVLRPQDLLAEGERILKPGGLMVIQVPYGGIEGAVNPDSDKQSFRSHVRTINPYELIEGKSKPAVFYIDYTHSVLSPHTMYGSVGDWCVAWEKA